MDPAMLRDDVPALEGATYLYTGASGPEPQRVLDAAADARLRHEVDAHRGNPYPHAWDAYDATRASVADLLGAAPADVALTESTADGISRVVNAVDWKPGDVVVRTDLEHPVGVLPFARLREEGVELREVPTPGGRLDVEAYRAAVEGARFVCLSSLSWLHGTHLDVAGAVRPGRRRPVGRPAPNRRRRVGRRGRRRRRAQVAARGLGGGIPARRAGRRGRASPPSRRLPGGKRQRTPRGSGSRTARPASRSAPSRSPRTRRSGRPSTSGRNSGPRPSRSVSATSRRDWWTDSATASCPRGPPSRGSSRSPTTSRRRPSSASRLMTSTSGRSPATRPSGRPSTCSTLRRT